MNKDIVTFLRRREYRYIKELGAGACGKTVLLLDDVIDLHFVCKKFAPEDPHWRDQLFANFMNEIKLMHLLHHPNVVRIFGYYAFEKERAGYIIMEYVEGETIDKVAANSPDRFRSIFIQAVDAFSYLQQCRILHRDIRFNNLLVRADGALKVIDLGFGKSINTSADFQKSITLNWAFPPPDEFAYGRYDFQTEIYFVGKLFEKIAEDVQIEDKQIREVLGRMCAPNPGRRIQSFAEVRQFLNQESFALDFSDEEVSTYRSFSGSLAQSIYSIDLRAEYIEDIQEIISKLDNVYKGCMLEEYVSIEKVLPCFLKGRFIRDDQCFIRVDTVKRFLNLLRTSTSEAQKVIIANLFTRLDSVRRYDDNDIPF